MQSKLRTLKQVAARSKPGPKRSRPPEEYLPASATGVAAPLSVAGSMHPLRVNLQLQGSDRDAVLRELVALAVPPHEQRLSATLFKALKVRESLCSTCVNEGVAIPHSRNALIGVVDHPMIAYGRHPVGIAYGALDGQSVQHFFLLCAPSVREHLQLLGRLARLVHRPEFRNQLRQAGTPEQVIDLVRRTEPPAA